MADQDTREAEFGRLLRAMETATTDDELAAAADQIEPGSLTEAEGARVCAVHLACCDRIDRALYIAGSTYLGDK